MADPFEVRMRFTSQLQHLNASITSSQKAAHYALKYKDMDEDLHSCILEQLERNSMNNRANIMYFIEHLCDMAQRENHREYVRMIQRDILRVVDAVAPEDGSGAANVKVIRRVLNGLQQKSILDSHTVNEIEACLSERDTMPANAVFSPSPATNEKDRGDDTENKASLRSSATTGTTAATSQGAPKKATGGASGGGGSSALTSGGGGGGGGAMARPDKRQIEQRIEEDRERHKRQRESIWAVDHGARRNAEFWKMWDEASEIGEDDYLMAAEEGRQRKACVEAWFAECEARDQAWEAEQREKEKLVAEQRDKEKSKSGAEARDKDK